jgi:hypothetical protein
MFDPSTIGFRAAWRHGGYACGLSPLIVLLATNLAWSQSAQPPATQPPANPPPVVQSTPAPGPEPTPAPNRPGLIDELGKLLQDSLPQVKSPQQAIEDLNARAKSATDNLSRFSGRQVVAGRVKCPVAANGAPDCKSAADKLCTDKGFKEGQSLDSDSAESCSASVLLSGKKTDTEDCRIENFVIRALCQ